MVGEVAEGVGAGASAVGTDVDQNLDGVVG